MVVGELSEEMMARSKADHTDLDWKFSPYTTFELSCKADKVFYQNPTFLGNWRQKKMLSEITQELIQDHSWC